MTMRTIKLGLGVELHHGDCLDIIASMPDASVDLVVTDPPYELLDMTIVFRELTRVLRKTGSIYVFGDKDVVAEHWFRQMNAGSGTTLVAAHATGRKAIGIEQDKRWLRVIAKRVKAQ